MSKYNFSLLGVIVTVAVVAVVIGGFMLAGSPETAKKQQIDLVRSDNLQQISSIVSNYYYQTKALPTTLASLYEASNNGAGFVDPETQIFYDYARKSDTSYELCAVFGTQSVDDSTASVLAPRAGPNFYQHGFGKECFVVTVLATAPILEYPIK